MLDFDEWCHLNFWFYPPTLVSLSSNLSWIPTYLSLFRNIFLQVKSLLHLTKFWRSCLFSTFMFQYFHPFHWLLLHNNVIMVLLGMRKGRCSWKIIICIGRGVLRIASCFIGLPFVREWVAPSWVGLHIWEGHVDYSEWCVVRYSRPNY